MGVVGRNIKGLRELEGWSQETLAEKLGVTRSAVSYYESGKIAPKMSVLEKIAALFGVSVAELVYDGDQVFHISDGVTEVEYCLLSDFRSLTPEQRANVSSLVSSMVQK